MNNKRFPVIKKCKQCGKEIIELHQTRKYCSYSCFRAFEDQPSTFSRGFMTRSAGDMRKGKTIRNEPPKKYGDPYSW